MDLLLVLLSATALTALGLVADRVGGDLRGGYRVAGRTDRTVDDDRPMRLDLLARSPQEVARFGPAQAEAGDRGTAEVRRPSVGTLGAARHRDPARPTEAIGA